LCDKNFEFVCSPLFVASREVLLAGSIVGKRIGGSVLLLEGEADAAQYEKRQEDATQRLGRCRNSLGPFWAFHDLVHQFARRFFTLISSGSIIEYRFGRTQREPIMRRSLLFLSAACAYAILSLACPFATAQIDNTTPE